MLGDKGSLHTAHAPPPTPTIPSQGKWCIARVKAPTKRQGGSLTHRSGRKAACAAAMRCKCTENGGARAAVIMTVGGRAPDQQHKAGSITVRVVSEERHERCDATYRKGVAQLVNRVFVTVG